MQANLLSLLTSGNTPGQKPSAGAASAPATDAFAQMLERHRSQQSQQRASAPAERNNSGPGNTTSHTPHQRTERQPAQQADTTQGAEARRTPEARQAKAANATEPANHPSGNGNHNTPSAATPGEVAHAAAESAQAVNQGQAAAAQTSTEARALALNPLVAQIQQLTERSRALADTVVALKTPTGLAAEAQALVAALQEASTPEALSALALLQSEAGTLAAGTELPPELAALAASLQANPALAAGNPALASAAALPAGWQPPAAAATAALPAGPLLAAPALANTGTPLAGVPLPGAEPAPSPASALPAPTFSAADAAAVAAAAERNAPTATLLQPAVVPAMPGAPAASGMVTATVAAPLGSPQWGQAFSQQMVRLGTENSQGVRVIEMRLDPPDLGPVRISLSLAGEQASAMFLSPHAAVRQAIELALPQLQQALADAGIQLGQTSVGEQNQETERNLAQGNRRDGGEGGGTGTDAALAEAPVRTTAPRGLVDTFA